MSTLMAPSRVAARTTLTSQVLSDWPDLAAASSALVLTDSGMRRVIRARPPSSSSSPGIGGAGGAGGAGTLLGAWTTKSRSRPSSRTSTPPLGSSAVISAAACEMASIRASRAAGSMA